MQATTAISILFTFGCKVALASITPSFFPPSPGQGPAGCSPSFIFVPSSAYGIPLDGSNPTAQRSPSDGLYGLSDSFSGYDVPQGTGNDIVDNIPSAERSQMPYDMRGTVLKPQFFLFPPRSQDVNPFNSFPGCGYPSPGCPGILPFPPPGSFLGGFDSAAYPPMMFTYGTPDGSSSPAPVFGSNEYPEQLRLKRNPWNSDQAPVPPKNNSQQNQTKEQVNSHDYRSESAPATPRRKFTTRKLK